MSQKRLSFRSMLREDRVITVIFRKKTDVNFETLYTLKYIYPLSIKKIYYS